MVYVGWILYKKIEADEFMLGINGFLIGGLVIYVFNIGWLMNFYSQFPYTTILLWLCIVGTITTFYTDRGFIGLKDYKPAVIRKLSIYLLLATIGATIFSWYFGRNLFIGAWLPFVFLNTLQEQLKRRASRF